MEKKTSSENSETKKERITVSIYREDWAKLIIDKRQGEIFADILRRALGAKE